MFRQRKNLHSTTDEDLMVLVGKGNEQAFSELYNRYADKMLRYFYRLLNKDEDKAQDMLHDLFMKLIEKPERYDSRQPFSPWLYRVATNMCYNETRNSQNRLRILEESYPREQAETADGDLHHLDLVLFTREYEKVFARLDEDQQMLLTLRFQQEMQVKEIAGIMGLAEGTVKSRLFYLLKKISVELYAFNPLK